MGLFDRNPQGGALVAPAAQQVVGGGGGGITWATPVDANIVPDAHNAYTVGEYLNRFSEGYFTYQATNNIDWTDAAVGSTTFAYMYSDVGALDADFAIEGALTGGTHANGLVFQSAKPILIQTVGTAGADYIGIYTGDSASAAQTGSIDTATGNLSGGTGTTGYYLFQSGAKTGGTGGGSGDFLSGTGDNAATGGKSGDAYFYTGNASVGDSGSVILTIGSAAGTQGDFKFHKVGTTVTVGHVWTATSADGKGYWAAAAGGGANTTLSNLGTTAINANLIFNTGAFALLKTQDNGAGLTRDIGVESGNAVSGDSGNVVIRSGTSSGGTRGFVRFGGTTVRTENNFVPDTNENINLGGASNTWQTAYISNIRLRSSSVEQGQISTSGTSPSGGAGVVALFSGQASKNAGVWTASTTASGTLYLETGNASAGNSGNINIQVGTATGTRGYVNFDAESVRFNATIRPTGVANQSVGSSSNPWGQMWSRSHYFRNNSNQTVLGIETSITTTPSGATISGSLLNATPNQLYHIGVITYDSSTTIASSAIYVETGNVNFNPSGAPTPTGLIQLKTGNTQASSNNPGATGSISILTGNQGSVAAGDSGSITLQTGTVAGSGARGSIILNANIVTVHSSIVPNTNNSKDLGASGQEFLNIYVDNLYSSGNCGAKVWDILNNEINDNTGVVSIKNAARELYTVTPTKAMDWINDTGVVFHIPLQLVPLASDPSGPSAGTIYFNTTSGKIKVYNGTTWETVTSV